MTTLESPLGGLSPKAFLRGYWQKRPLLVRQAIPGFTGLLDKRTLFDLATTDTAESRLIEHAPDWRVTAGPFARRTLSRLPTTNWTLLVNGINLHLPKADALLQQFAFASWARLDDVMVSYAADGGGVGPHVDSYDVFLLQGPGRRRWRLMPPSHNAFRLVEGAPLNLIADFRPTDEMILEPGDMLYLPPGWGHEGTAIGACQTYSIGFRAPAGAELSAAFLDYLHERGFADAAYSDPDRRPAAHPGYIDAHLISYACRVLNGIQWDTAVVADFLARYLSEPKQHVYFDPPERPISRSAFLRKLASARIRLDPRTRMLSHDTRVYVNGEAFKIRRSSALRKLADRREVEGARLAREPIADLVFDWYRRGFVVFETSR